MNDNAEKLLHQQNNERRYTVLYGVQRTPMKLPREGATEMVE